MKYILSRLVHSTKQYPPSEVTDEGIVMEVKPLQPLKHPPNEVTDEGIVMEVKLRQPEKQYIPSEVTDEGIVMEVKLRQPENVLLVDYQYYTL